MGQSKSKVEAAGVSPPTQGAHARQAELTAGDELHELAAVVALLQKRVASGPELAAIIEHEGSVIDFATRSLAAGGQLFPAAPSTTLGSADFEEALLDVQRWRRAGLNAVTVLSPGYPLNLHSVCDRPPFVFIRGQPSELDHRSIAIVGTRKASDDGRARARRLAREMSAAGYAVVSGLAVGIDAEAHAETLRVGGRTVAVMGTGINHVYPAQNRALAEQIVAAGGALYSQFFPDQPPQKWTFPARNAVMSGMALGTIVVEAGKTSGARMQARLALRHGRPVFLLSSLVRERQWAYDLVANGAHGTRAAEVGSSDEILDYLEPSAVASPDRLALA